MFGFTLGRLTLPISLGSYGFALVLVSHLVAVGSDVTLRDIRLPIRHVDYQFAVKEEDSGLRRFDWDLFRQRPRTIVSPVYDCVVLENDVLRVTLMPSRGRVHSLINKATGHELLWINPCALPLGANNDTGFWMTWGGLERVLPRREHGTTHALEWRSQVILNTDRQVTVLCRVTEPLTGIHLELYYSLYADRDYLETVVVVENPTPRTQHYSYWTTALFAPGGENEVTADTELVFPAERFVPDDRDFNDWMVPLVGPVATSPLRIVGQWKSIGDLMTSPLSQPYYGVYSHEAREGVAHTFDLAETPTVDVWGWGYPPTPARQREFTAEPPNKGYIEIWNGNVRGFSDEVLASLEPGEFKMWTERTFAIENLAANDLRNEIETRVAKVDRGVLLAGNGRAMSRSGPTQPRIERTVVAEGDGDYDWFQTRAVWLPAPYRKGLLLLQQKTHDGSHGYYDVYASSSTDRVHWSSPAPIPSLKRRRNADGYHEVVGDLWPEFHAATGKVVATGKTFNFRNGTEEDILREKVAYAVFDPNNSQWSDLQTMSMPSIDHTGRPIIAPNAGCNQPVFKGDGSILLPVRYQTGHDWRNYVSVVVECAFDGSRLSYGRHGTEHAHPVGRGLYEPSLIEFRGRYYLTLRSDRDGFVTSGKDGIHFDEVVRWRFDDGEPLQSYNTQQHWIAGGGRLYLAYTRRRPDTGHIIRHRAPLYLAEVDPESLRVVRATEQILVPEEGRALGNSGVCRISDNESWVVVGEGAPARGTPWTANRVILAKVYLP